MRDPPRELGAKAAAAALTAYARAEDRLLVLRAGFEMHDPKPVEPAELVTSLTTLARIGRTLDGTEPP